MEREIWNKLIEAARNVVDPRKIGDHIEVGGVGAALLSESGAIYTGVCIDTACSLGMCAERSALAALITAGESRVEKLVCLSWDYKPMFPCGACREFLTQMGNKDLEILTDLETLQFVTLYALTPNWWI